VAALAVIDIKESHEPNRYENETHLLYPAACAF
jgi:hypothetical protein